MRTLWRALPALLIGATLVAPAAPATAGWSCSYYRWESRTQEWKVVAHLRPRDEFRRTHVLGVDYHCEYCYIPAVPPRDPDEVLYGVDGALAVAGETVRSVWDAYLPVTQPGPVTSPGPVDPWNGPACPPVPPVWDAEELDTVGGIG